MNIPPNGMGLGMGNAPTPYSGTGPYAPPPLQQPTPIHPPKNQEYQAGDVSPIEEKAVPAVTVMRKEVAKTPGVSAPSSPSPVSAVPAAPTDSATEGANRGVEVPGSVPPPRHEIPTDGEITNSLGARGPELDGVVVNQQQQYSGQDPGQQQYPGQQSYPGQVRGQGQWAYNYPQQQQMQAHEVDGSAVGASVQRQELSGNGYGYGQSNGGQTTAYELGPGR